MNSKFYLIDKPIEITSRKVCNFLQKQENVKRIGHSGTLDPFATGLMIIGVGNAPKLFPYIESSKKTYTGTFKIGESTDTLDNTGNVTATSSIEVSLEDIVNSSMKFVGKISQRVPNYSAAKIDGKRRYQLAREGKELPDKYVERHVYKIEIESLPSGEFEFTATVSNGTYIRQLFNDITLKLNVESHLTSLRRTSIGEISVDNAHSIDSAIALDVDKVITDIKKIELSEQKDDFLLGRFVELKQTDELLFASDSDGIYAIIEKIDNNIYKVKKQL